jgi:DNA-binding LytR/AlgR family response regulator
MKIKCLVIEDDPNYREIISGYIKKIDSLQLIAACADPMEAHQFIISDTIQLLFSDIEMGELSGIEYIKSLKNPPLVIFISSYPKYALEGYEVEAIHFLEKPILFSQFLKAVNRATTRLALAQDERVKFLKQEENHFYISDKNQWIKLEYNNVIYIEADGDFVNIITSEKKYLVLVNLKNIEGQLPSDIFIRSHRFFLVNKVKIHSISKDGQIKVDKYTIPLGDTYRENLHNLILRNRLIKRSPGK